MKLYMGIRTTVMSTFEGHDEGKCYFAMSATVTMRSENSGDSFGDGSRRYWEHCCASGPVVITDGNAEFQVRLKVSFFFPQVSSQTS